MSALLPDWPLLSAFLAASFVLAVTPGPAVLYIVTRSLAQGRRSGLASVAGVALGNLGNAASAAVTDTAYALAAGAAAPRLGRARGAQALGRRLAAGAFIGLGIFTALSGSRGSVKG